VKVVTVVAVRDPHGVPVIDPVVLVVETLSCKQFGRAVVWYVYGSRPPANEIVAVYGTPLFPFDRTHGAPTGGLGGLHAVSVKTGGVTTVIVAVFVVDVLATNVAVSVTLSVVPVARLLGGV